jgi:ribose transport system substrate-binding protein
MAQTLKDKYGAGSTVTFLMVEGFPGDSNSARREKGFNEGYASVADAPTLNTLTTVHGHFVADDAVAPVRSVATANPDLQAMFVVTDSMLPGVRTALEGAGMWGQVTIAGYDAQMAVVKQIRDDPDGPLVATVANSPYDQGSIGVEMVDKALNDVPQDQACPGGNHYLPPTLVTAANAAEYYRDDVDY